MTKKILATSVVTAMMLTLVGCGGGSDPKKLTDDGSIHEVVKTGTSYYKDSAVQGIKVISGGTESTTDIDGKFTFEVGKGCKFSLAGIPLRSTPADELVDGGTILEDNPKVAKLLQSIDADGDLSNGIQITPEVLSVLTAALENHDSVGELPKAAVLVAVVADVGKIDGVEGVVKTDEEVATHLAETKLKELLAGKTFYVVNNGEFGVSGGKAVFNAEATKMTFTGLYGDSDKGMHVSNITIDDNELYFDDDKGFHTIFGKNQGDYIEATEYNNFNQGQEHSRFYFDEAKANEYAQTLGDSETPPDFTHQPNPNPTNTGFL